MAVDLRFVAGAADVAILRCGSLIRNPRLSVDVGFPLISPGRPGNSHRQIKP
jgi:hypothetical protein